MIKISKYLPENIKTIIKYLRRRYFAIWGTCSLALKGFKFSDKEFLRKLKDHNNINDYIFNLKRREKPTVFVNTHSPAQIIELLNSTFPSTINGKIIEAKKKCEHIFNILGSGEKKIERLSNSGEKLLDWKIDIKSDRKWPNIHAKGINVQELNKSSDIKVPWELSRFQHLLLLGEVYWITNDDRFVEEFKLEVVSWIESNPIGLGVNWVCSMEVAIRAVNWLCSFQFFKESPLIDKDFLTAFSKSLYYHGKHIRNNLEYGSITNNHYLANLVGLIFLGTLCPEFKESVEWKKYGIEQLKLEMQKQVNNDGMDFEGSTFYHRLSLEFFFFSALLVLLNEEIFIGDYEKVGRIVWGDVFIDKLYKMFEYALYVIKPNGNFPQIGDNDNGVLFSFSQKSISEMKYLLALGAVFFNEEKFKINEFGCCEELIWLLGNKGLKKYDLLTGRSIREIESKAFENSGIYVIRDEEVYCIIHCSQNGQNGLGGHNHNDVLSFELNYLGKDIIIDPGTYCYTGDYKMRNYFRSTYCHNTVVIDGEEINRFDSKNLFSLKNEAKPRILKWENERDKVRFKGEHYGYSRLNDPVVHAREITYLKNNKKITIKDTFSGIGKHVLEWNIILAPDISYLKIDSEILEWKELDTYYSSEYGVFNKTTKLYSFKLVSLPFEVVFEIDLLDLDLKCAPRS